MFSRSTSLVAAFAFSLFCCNLTEASAQSVEISSAQTENQLKLDSSYFEDGSAAQNLSSEDFGYSQVQSINSFLDVQPTDWAYQALKNLVETYGCVAGYPNGTFVGSRSISRYEAAALLNACLDVVSTITDELRRLIYEFEVELALIKGRVDGLEARVGELEATQFSTTTKLSVTMAWLLGGTGYGGDGADAVRSGERDAFLPNAYNGINNGPGFATDAFSFSYASRFDLNTSFTGKDLLKVRMEVGNMTNNSFGINTATPLSLYAWFFPKGQADNQMVIQRMNYTFPLGDKFTVTAGPLVRQDEMLGSWPVNYPTNAPLFGVPWYAGAPAAYNLNQGAGGAITYRDKVFNSNMAATAMYISRWGESGNPTMGGIGNENSGAITTAQLGFSGEKWTVSGIYTYSQDNYASANSQGTPAYYTTAILNSMHSYGLAGFYDFNADNTWAPILNLGAGYNQHDDSLSSESASWWVGLMWKDLFAEGHSLGVSTGQPTFIISDDDGNGDDGNYFIEAFYSFKITDGISLTPTVLWLSRPYGQMTEAITGRDTFTTLAGILKVGINF